LHHQGLPSLSSADSESLAVEHYRAVLDKDGAPLLNPGAGVDFLESSFLQATAIVGNSVDKASGATPMTKPAPILIVP